MKIFPSIIFLLFSANAFCCSVLNPPPFSPTFTGTVIKIEEIPDSKQRIAGATILITESKNEHFKVGNEYKFIVSGSNGHGGCSAKVKVNETYNIEANYIPPEIRKEKYKEFDSGLGILSVGPVNQALKGQPSAAGDAASGAP